MKGSDTLRFGQLTDRTAHLCIDMQNLFAERTPWHTPWMTRVLPVVLRIADTTELNFNGQDIEGAGPLCYEAQVGVSSRDLCGDTGPGAAGCDERMDVGARTTRCKRQAWRR